ncbi:hypothetical protein NE237_007063 [Protea cynaroides]|uniref:Uncharacterized protein n=1 Tax=Protea cynaroides TaxID=273540 RepID=A0A9Q0QW40_9MAGN|nr:hypothetical protein NE237_007063 [Protea cynaroides]
MRLRLALVAFGLLPRTSSEDRGKCLYEKGQGSQSKKQKLIELPPEILAVRNVVSIGGPQPKSSNVMPPTKSMGKTFIVSKDTTSERGGVGKVKKDFGPFLSDFNLTNADLVFVKPVATKALVLEARLPDDIKYVAFLSRGITQSLLSGDPQTLDMQAIPQIPEDSAIPYVLPPMSSSGIDVEGNLE